MSEISQIIFDYANAEKQATHLEELAEKLGGLSASDMEGILGEVDSAWKGDNANAFLQKGNKIQSNIAASADELKKKAATIRTISENLRKADEDAAVLAEGE